MRLIDKDSFIKEYNNRCRGDCCCCLEETNSISGCKVIDEAPVIDAVPVVRCRECKCYPKDFDEDSWNWCCGIGDDTKPNDFCSYGQRREDGNGDG